MSGPFFSRSWFRVADVRPWLKAHARIHPQRYRGTTWYVLQDPQTGRFHRLSAAANIAVSLMDGTRTVAQVWEMLGVQLAERQPTQDELIRLLRQLHASDLLGGDVPTDLDELTRRGDDQARRALFGKLRNPIAIRVPLLDPDRFLSATMPAVAPVFTVAGFVLWSMVVAAAAMLAVVHWSALGADVADRALLPSNLVVMLLVYPFVKALHELGHGWATKRWGGQVHEIGVMLLALFPVPYVDASDSASFESKWRRAVVGSAGIMVELLLASLAMFVWLLVEPGLVRAVAFNVMLIAGISTLLFNGNPLLRYDGYYVLADLIEIPNLGPRANQYLIYVIKRRLLGLQSAQSPVTAHGEATWFVVYGVVSLVYRMALTVVIALYLATKAFLLGVLLAIVAVMTAVAFPLLRSARYLATSPELRLHRGRSIGAVAMAASAMLVAAFLWPLPYATLAEGVVWVPEDATLRAGTVVRLLAEPGAQVRAGQPLVKLSDPLLDSRVAVLEARQRQISLRLAAARVLDLVTSRMYVEQLADATTALERERSKRDELVVRAGTSGRFTAQVPEDLPGRLLERGALIGYVIDSAHPVVRVLVGQDDIDLIRERRGRVQVRFAQRPAEVFEAAPLLETPAAIDRLPSAVLGREGGGPWAEAPDASGQTRLVQKAFVMDFRVAGAVPGDTVGARVHVRLDHGREAIAWRGLRGLRQLFLRRLDV